jgi:hypothetical protein
MLTFLIGIPYLYLLKGISFNLKMNNFLSRVILVLLTLPSLLFLIIYMTCNTIENIILYVLASILLRINRNLAYKVFTPIKNYFYIVPDQISAEKNLIKTILVNRINSQNNYSANPESNDEKKEQ